MIDDNCTTLITTSALYSGAISVQDLKDEDSESGTGASLPHSPETVQQKELQQDKQDTELPSPEVERQLNRSVQRGRGSSFLYRNVN